MDVVQLGLQAVEALVQSGAAVTQGIDQIVQASQPKDAEITCEISRCTW